MNINEFIRQRKFEGAWTSDGKRTLAYIKSLCTQTRLWMDGYSTHNILTHECVLDFSCCHPEMRMNQVDRWIAGEKQLLTFLEGRCERCYCEMKDGICQNYGCEGTYKTS